MEKENLKELEIVDLNERTDINEQAIKNVRKAKNQSKTYRIKILAMGLTAIVIGIGAKVGVDMSTDWFNSKTKIEASANTESTETLAIKIDTNDELVSKEEEVDYDLSDFSELLNDRLFADIIKNMLENMDRSKAKEYLNEYLAQSNNKTFSNLLIDIVEKEQTVIESIKLEDIKYYNNLNKENSILPRQICIFEKVVNYGGYNYYTLKNNRRNIYLITNRFGDIVVMASLDQIYKVENQKLSSFEDLLKKQKLGHLIKESYTPQELYNDILFKINSLLTSKEIDIQNIKSEDTIVLDTEGIQTDYPDDENQYDIFIKISPYLFAENATVYKDIFDEDNKLVIDSDYFFKYYNTNYYDKDSTFEDGYDCIIKLPDFLKELTYVCKETHNIGELKSIHFDINYNEEIKRDK